METLEPEVPVTSPAADIQAATRSTQTLENVQAASPSLLTSHIDSRLVKIRPMASPIDQISRHATRRHASSMKVDYYSIDMRRGSMSYSDGLRRGTAGFSFKVTEPLAWAVSDTVVFAESYLDGFPATGYVTGVEGDVVSGQLLAGDDVAPAALTAFKLAPRGTVARMGRAAHELDVMTDVYNAVPKKSFNYCQIFKAQVEQSTLLTLSSKEVGWTLSDQEESAIMDMRQAMERSFLFGERGKHDIDGKEIITTRGIWRQAGKASTYNTLDADTMNRLCREAFTGHAGSSRKILVGGSQFIHALHALGADRVITNDHKVVKWGLDFSEYVTKFGTLYIIASETFDQVGMADAAMIIDPEYLVKYSHQNFNVESLNLRQAGVRNVKAMVATEASCLVLRYPQAHMRITRQA